MSREPLGFLSGLLVARNSGGYNRGQGGVRHREHVSPLGVLVLGRSAASKLTTATWLTFSTRGVRFVGPKECGPVTRESEDGARAVGLHDHPYFC